MEPNKNNSGTNNIFNQTPAAFGSFSFSSSSTTPQSSPAKGSIFGATSSATPQGSIFGNTSNNKPGSTLQNAGTGNTAAASTPKAPIFGGGVNSFNTGTASSNIFNTFSPSSGNPNPASSTPSFSLNANQPNQAPQASSLFGSKNQATSNNIFSNPSTTGSPASNPTAQTTSTPTFSFGAPSTNNAPAKDAGANQSSIFGSGTNKDAASTTAPGPSLFGSKPADSSSAANTNPFGSKPADSSSATNTNIFGSKPAESSPAANTNLFGSKPADSSPANTNLFGSKPADSLNLNKAPSSAPVTTTTTTSTSSNSIFSPSLPSKPTGSLFGAAPGNSNTGGFSMKSSTAPAKSSPLAMNSTTNNNGVGESNSQTTTTVNASNPAAGTAPATPSSQATTNNTSTKPSMNLAPSLLKGKTLEDLVSRWNSELDERVEDFKLTASEIAAWDQVLIQNGDQISALYEELQRIDPVQSSIDQTLDYVETQQRELSAALEDYERQLTSQQAGGVVDMTMMTGGNNRNRTAGQEREEAYKTAEEVHAQLNDMVGSLGTMIAELNSLAGPANRIDESSITDGPNLNSNSTSSLEDPIVQISGILNAHLGSLNWISEISNELCSKILELENRISNTKLEFGLESNSIHPNKQSSDLDDLNLLSLSNNFGNNNLASHPTSNQGFGSMRNSSGLSSHHPRR